MFSINKNGLDYFIKCLSYFVPNVKYRHPHLICLCVDQSYHPFYYICQRLALTGTFFKYVTLGKVRQHVYLFTIWNFTIRCHAHFTLNHEVLLVLFNSDFFFMIIQGPLFTNFDFCLNTHFILTGTNAWTNCSLTL